MKNEFYPSVFNLEWLRIIKLWMWHIRDWFSIYSLKPLIDFNLNTPIGNAPGTGVAYLLFKLAIACHWL